jgi:hypothetical protein
VKQSGNRRDGKTFALRDELLAVCMFQPSSNDEQNSSSYEDNGACILMPVSIV